MQHGAEKNLKVVSKAGCHLRKYRSQSVRLISELLLGGGQGESGVIDKTLECPTRFLDFLAEVGNMKQIRNVFLCIFKEKEGVFERSRSVGWCFLSLLILSCSVFA